MILLSDFIRSHTN